jgi:hypothetical protein
MKPIEIGSRLELMVDDDLLERLDGSLRFQLHRPVAREVIHAIADEHGCPYRYMTVFKDRDLYRMYYGLPKVRNGRAVKGQERICLAQSNDGIHWDKPSLGLFEYEGSSDNNIVWMEQGRERLGVGGFSPFKDEHPDCPPEHRYKAVAEAGPKGKEMLGSNGLLALSSPDGVHWSMLSPELIVRPGRELSGFDSQNLAFWDASRGEYRLYRRASFAEGPLNMFRDILTSTSRDFLHWDEPQRLCYLGAIPEQLYTNNVVPYFRAPHLFVGFPVRYVQRPWSEAIADLPEQQRRKAIIRNAGAEPTETAPTEAGGQRIGTSLTDTLFMSSRDGVNFKRWDEAFIRPGLRYKNNWFYPDNFQNWGMVTTPSDIEGAPQELSFYVSEGGRRENQSNICRRYSMRVDGFVSIQASREGGQVLTRPLVFSGRELVVNFSASAAGSVRIEVRDERGWPIPGFEREHCIELLGDDLERVVRWKEGKDLSALAGRPVRLSFELNDADLYSFRFQ